MVTCCAVGCVNRSDRSHRQGVTFHKFPSEPIRRELWVQAVQRGDWQPALRSVLCSDHFKEEDFDRSSISSVRLRPGAVPSIFPDPNVKTKKSFKSRTSSGRDYGFFSLSARLCEISAAFLQEEEKKESISNLDTTQAPVLKRKLSKLPLPEESCNTKKDPCDNSKIRRTSDSSETLMPHKFLEVQLDENELPPEILSRVMKCNKSLSLTVNKVPMNVNRIKTPVKVTETSHRNVSVDSESSLKKMPKLPHEFLEIQLRVQEEPLEQTKLSLNFNEISIVKVPKHKTNATNDNSSKAIAPFQMSKELSSMFNFESLKET